MENSYRLFQWDDIDEIVSIICDTWQLDKMCKDYKQGIIFSKQYLYHVLKDASDIYVAIDHDKVIGLLVLSLYLKNKITIPKKYQQYLLKIDENETKVKDYQKMIIDYKQNCLFLYKNSAIKFANEIVLFAVDRRYQGKGIGTELFKLAGSIFEKEAHSSYYLYTDTSCNYRYYDHLGMKKMGSLKPRKQDDFEIYLYGKN